MHILLSAVLLLVVVNIAIAGYLYLASSRTRHEHDPEHQRTVLRFANRLLTSSLVLGVIVTIAYAAT